MTQRHLVGLPVLPVALKDIKKEPEQTVLLHCSHCPRSLEVFIDSQRNESPFTCGECWAREPCNDQKDRAVVPTERELQALAIVWTETGLQVVPVIMPGLSSLM